jgi:RHS repeat-associated protein
MKKNLLTGTINHKKFRFASVILFLLLIGCGLEIEKVFAGSDTDGRTPSHLTPGAPAGSYGISNFENVNLFNGHLNVTMPLSSLAGRGDVGYSVNLPIEQQWRILYFGAIYENNPYPADPANGGGIMYPPPAAIVPVGQWWTNLKPGYSPGVVIGRRAGSGERGQVRSWSPRWEAWVPACPDTIKRYEATLTRINFVMSDGTEVELRDKLTNGKPEILPEYDCSTVSFNRGTTFVSADGSNTTFISDTPITDHIYNPMPNNVETFGATGYLMTGNGAKYRVEAGRIIWMKDRNGNTSSFVYSSNGIQEATDSIGRKTEFTYGNVSGDATYDEIKFAGMGGQQRVVKVWYKDMGEILRSGYVLKPYRQLFPLMTDASDQSIFNPKKVSMVELPDGRKFEYFYNSYGELAKMITPIGEVTEYDWDFGYGNKKEKIVRRLMQRRIYNDGILQNKTLYGDTGDITGSTQSPMPGAIEVRDAANNLLSYSTHSFHGNPVEDAGVGYGWYEIFYSGGLMGREFRTVSYDIVGGTPVMKTSVERTWENREPISWYGNSNNNPYQYFIPDNDPRLIETKITLHDTNQIAKTVYKYKPGIDYNLQSDVEEYDYGTGQAGAFKRKTHTDYITDPVYTSNVSGTYLRGLPSRSWVSTDINGTNKVSLSAFEYDNYAADQNHAQLLSRYNVFGHDAANFDANYTRRGNATAVTSYADANNQTGAVTVYSQYDILGNIVKTVDAKGNASTIDYADRFGSPDGEAQSNAPPVTLSGQSTFAFASAATNAAGWTAYSQFDYHTGASVNSEDMNGIVSKTIYNDVLDRPTQAVTAIGTQFEKQSNIIYDDINRRIETKGDLYALNDNLIKAESFYDSMGRTFESRKYEADGGYIAAKTEYDALGRAYRQTNPYRPNEINAQNPVVWTVSRFDAMGRMKEIETPDGAKVKTAYEGTRVLVTDQAGKQRMSKTNALGQLTDVWEIKAADADTEAVSFGGLSLTGLKTSYGYDGLNNLTAVNQGGQTRSFAYDSLSRLRSATNPELGTTPTNGTINYQYDNNGNLTNKTDPRNITTSYTYDALNRVISRSYNDNLTPTVAYTYDNLPNAKGKLTKVSSLVSTTEYTAFDIVGRVKNHRQTTDGQIYDTEYVYNLSGALIEETYPSGRVVKNTLDADGMLQQVQSKKANDTFRNYANSFNYTAVGAVSSVRLGNGKWENTVFNSRLQPVQIGLGNSATDRSLLKLDFTYNTAGQNDNNGNVLSQTITVGAAGGTPGFTAVQTYTYDALNRIYDAKENINGNPAANWKQTFEYDRYGNRRFNELNTTTITKNCTSGSNAVVCAADVPAVNPTINQTNNRLDGYTFDTAGNTTVDALGRSFIYDAENKQTEVRDSQSNPIGKYYYDGDGKRVKKVAGNETTIFIYDAAGKLVAEYSNQTNATPQISYLTNDHLGSPRINTDASGAVTARHDYQPFGEEITRASYGNDDVRKQFTGYEKDEETDLDFAQARYFNSGVGRFSSPDDFLNDTSVSDPASWNLYVYVRNNPLRFIDPNGEEIRKKDDGTVDFKKTSDEKIKAKPVVVGDRQEATINGKKQMITIKAVATVYKGVIYSDNDGKTVEIEAYQQANPLEIVITNDEGDNLFSGTVEEFSSKFGDNSLDGYSSKSNCHGTTFANGEVTIDNDQVKKLMTAEGYDINNSSNTPQGVDSVGVFTENGKLSTTRHSVKVSSLNPTQVVSKGGIQPTRITTPADSWTNIRGNGRENHKLNYYQKKVQK